MISGAGGDRGELSPSKGFEEARAVPVRLFASMPGRDPGGCYDPVMPVEKVRIRVEDASFLVLRFVVACGTHAQAARNLGFGSGGMFFPFSPAEGQ